MVIQFLDVLKQPETIRYILAAVVLARVCQRFYYFVRGHKQHIVYYPRQAMEAFLKKCDIKVTQHAFNITQKSNGETLPLRYRRLGSGKKFILLANGVGTDFFMWLPLLKNVVKFHATFFDDYTLIVPSYRGLFEPDDTNFPKTIDITIDNCGDDIKATMAHAKVDKYHAIIGWSTGAQVALACCAKDANTSAKLILLNPSPGNTLHTALQALVPLPKPIGRVVSAIVHGLINSLKPLIGTVVWDGLKVVAYSPVFRGILECSSFCGGFPPEQGSFFHEYMRDVFKTRTQTRSLLDLILSLDAPCPPGADVLSHPSLIVSGWMDFITGEYHARGLHASMPASKHLCFSMGSHFVLLEWPDLLAQAIVDFLKEEDS
jgi:pimeloyl-ACP methyl ester carboxylesterase